MRRPTGIAILLVLAVAIGGCGLRWHQRNQKAPDDANQTPVMGAYRVGDLIGRYIDFYRAHPIAASRFERQPPSAESLGHRRLVDVVEDVIDADWQDQGGRGAELHLLEDRLLVIAPPWVHRQLQQLLGTLRGLEGHPAAAVTLPSDEGLYYRLGQRIGELDLKDASLQKALDSLAKAVGVDIMLDVENVDARSIKPLTLNLHDVSLDSALSSILQLASHPKPLVYCLGDGFIVVTSDEAADRRPLKRIYDVRDLFEPRFEKRYYAAHPSAAKQTTLLGWGPYSPYEDAIGNLIGLIRDVIEPASWKDNGGNTGAIGEFAGRLVVTNTPAAHRQIEQLLDRLRKTPAQFHKSALPAGKRAIR